MIKRREPFNVRYCLMTIFIIAIVVAKAECQELLKDRRGNEILRTYGECNHLLEGRQLDGGTFAYDEKGNSIHMRDNAGLENW